MTQKVAAAAALLQNRTGLLTGVHLLVNLLTKTHGTKSFLKEVEV